MPAIIFFPKSTSNEHIAFSVLDESKSLYFTGWHFKIDLDKKLQGDDI